MERKIEFFTVREVLESALKGMCNYKEEYNYEIIFYNNTTDMENAKMFIGVWYKQNFYELKIVMKRDRVDLDYNCDVKGDKGILYSDFYEFIQKYYSLLNIKQSYNKLYIVENLHDYEVSFIQKKLVKSNG